MAATFDTVRPSELPLAGRRGLVSVVIAVAVLVATACSNDDPLPTTAGSGAGADLYDQSCAACHGTDLRGTARGPSHLSQVYAADHHPDASFRAAISQGSAAHHWDFGDMPPVDGLSDDEIDLIIAYIRDQQETHGLEPYPPR